MRIVKPYRQLNRLATRETMEPLWSWGLRMAIASSIPIIWGLYTGHVAAASWIAFTAECICWAGLKGDYLQRVRLLAGGVFLSLAATFLGATTGGNIWFSVGLMVVVGFVSALFKNLGDRGSGLSLSVYVIFIFNNAFPTDTLPELQERMWLALLGGIWIMAASLFASLLIPAQQPYRRTIAVIWKTISDLTVTISRGWEGQGVRSNEHDIYLKEQAVRNAIDLSLEQFEKLADQANESDTQEYKLAHIRKSAALVGSHIQAISEELSSLSINALDDTLRIKIFTILRALMQTVDRMAVYVATLKEEEGLILRSRINRLEKLLMIIKEYPLPEKQEERDAILRFIHLSERTVRLLDNATNNVLDITNDKLVVRTYPLLKTFFILHPKYWVRQIRLLFNFNSFTTKYALRTGIAAGLAMWAYRYFEIDHGYWIPFTMMIVIQTYIRATIKKATDRIIGTILGGVAGGLILHLPMPLEVKEFLLLLSSILMIVYIRKRYAISVFFITLNLVLLFNISDTIDNQLIITRAVATAGGALLAIIAGFALLPHSDKVSMPKLLASAIENNYRYFLATFYPVEHDEGWTRYKRLSETGNSNVFDSFSRYMHEPGFRKRPYAIFFYVITHNIRVTRELNNIRLEQDDKHLETVSKTASQHQERINECLLWFNKNIALLKSLDKEKKVQLFIADEDMYTPFELSDLQLIYLEKLTLELKAMHYDMEVLSQKMSRIMQL